MNFSDRLKNDEQFKELAEAFFKKFLDNKVFYQEVGQETNLLPIHNHIRYKRDLTTEFMRHFPDAFVCWSSSKNDKESWFIDLKVAKTGFKFDKAGPLVEMRKKVSDLMKEEIINIELESWNNMVRLRSIDINVVLWIYCSFHPTDNWLAIIPDNNLNLKKYDTSEMKNTSGSGTPIANVFSRIDNTNVYPLKDWIIQQYDLEDKEIEIDEYFSKAMP